MEWKFVENKMFGTPFYAATGGIICCLNEAADLVINGAIYTGIAATAATTAGVAAYTFGFDTAAGAAAITVAAVASSGVILAEGKLQL